MTNIRLLVASFIAGASLAFASTLTCAHGYKLGAIAIGHPFAQTTLPGQPNGGAYLKLDNQGGADKLLSASTPVSKSVEMHMTSMDGDVMRMRQVDAIELPANKVVELKPGATHLMLLGLKAPLKEGESFPLTLKFEKAGEVVVDVKVQTLQPTQPSQAASAHHH